MSIHIEDLSSAVYGYHPGDSYAKGSRPRCISVLCRSDHGEVEVMATMGELTRADVLELLRQLALRGQHRVLIKRPTGHKMPFGTLVRSEGAFDYYQIDL